MATRRPSTLRIVLKLVLLLAPLVAAVLLGPRLLQRYGAEWIRAHLQWTAPAPPQLADAVGLDSPTGGRAGGPAPGPAAAGGSSAPSARGGDEAGQGDPESAASRLAELEKEHLGHSTVITPQDARPDARGERVRRFQGFGLSVESRPAGATVLVDGAEVGETPLVTSLECTPGAKVIVEVRKGLYVPQRRETRCREDALVELRVDLGAR